MTPPTELASGPMGGNKSAVSGSAWLFSWPLLIGTGAYFYFFSNAKTLLRDGDTYWHIAAGQWIFKHLAIPTHDLFSHSMRDAPWTAHEWLSEVILAAAHQVGSWTLVVAMTALAGAVAIALLTRALLRWLEPIYAVMFAGLAISMTAGHVLARPHILAMPLMMIWTIELVHASDERRSPRLWLLPVMTLWANLHGGFTLGIALAIAFALEALLAAWKEKRIDIVARSWGIFVALAVICSMLTPQGPEGILFTWQVMVKDGYALDWIGEWISPDFHVLQPLEVWLLGGLALALHQGLRLPPIRLVLLLGLLHLSLKHIRYIELVGLLAPLFVASPFAAQWRLRKQESQQLEGADRFFGMLARPAGQFAMVTSLALVLAVPAWMSRFRAIEPPVSAAPAPAIRAAQQAGAKGPVLNDYRWGGYLIYSGIPVFIDGRADLYAESLLKEYVESLGLKTSDGLQKLLAKYQIAWTLLEPRSPAVALLDLLPDWRRVYTDETAVVHIRADGSSRSAQAHARPPAN